MYAYAWRMLLTEVVVDEWNNLIRFVADPNTIESLKWILDRFVVGNRDGGRSFYFGSYF